MSTLNKEQIQKLAPEQQQAYASMLASRARLRQELLAQTRQPWPYRFVAGIIFAAAVGLALAGRPSTLSLCLVLLALLVQIHAIAVHRRLDALLKLLDAELKSPTEREDAGPPVA